MKNLFAKTAIILGILLITGIMFFDFIRTYSVYDPRKSVYNKYNVSDYSYFVAGDSAFCSSYVRQEGDTLWKQMEKRVHAKVLPCALTGAHIKDIVDQVTFIAASAKKGSTVVMNLLPTKNYRDEERPYRESFDLLLGKHRDLLRNTLFFDAYIAINIFKYHHIYGYYDNNIINKSNPLLAWPGAVMRPVANNFGNKIWYMDEDPAFEKYMKFYETIDGTRPGDYSALSEMDRFLEAKGIKILFVISPVNYELVEKWSFDKTRQAKTLFAVMVKAMKGYLEENNLDYIDLSTAVDSRGFADLYHTNTDGDRIVAEEIARHVLGRETRLVNPPGIP